MTRFKQYLNEENSEPPAGSVAVVQDKGKSNYYLKLYSEKWTQFKGEITPKGIYIYKFLNNTLSQDEILKLNPNLEFEGSKSKKVKGLPDLYALPIGSKIEYVDLNKEYEKIDEDKWKSEAGKEIETSLFNDILREGKIKITSIKRI